MLLNGWDAVVELLSPQDVTDYTRIYSRFYFNSVSTDYYILKYYGLKYQGFLTEFAIFNISKTYLMIILRRVV